MCGVVAVPCHSFSLLSSSVVGVRLLKCPLTGKWGAVASLLLLCVVLKLVTISESMRSVYFVSAITGFVDCRVCAYVIITLLTVYFRGIVAGLCSVGWAPVPL